MHPVLCTRTLILLDVCVFVPRLSVELNNGKVDLNGGVLLAHSQDLSVQFDRHKIVLIQQLLARFPHELLAPEGEEIRGREKFRSRLTRQENEIM